MKAINCEGVVKTLIEKNITVSTAESCTGGMLGQCITSVSGASAIYGFGFITYANGAKEKILGVSHETLLKYGAVSEQTAREMALGAHKQSGAKLCVSVTGIAGPTGGTKETPVGLVYVGLYFKGNVRAVKLLLSGSREDVRIKTCESVFKLIAGEIK